MRKSFIFVCVWTLSWEAELTSPTLSDREKKTVIVTENVARQRPENNRESSPVKQIKMASRRKSKRSLSLRTASFIRLLTPFGGNGDRLTAAKLSAEEAKLASGVLRRVDEGETCRLYPAVSDSQLHMAATNSVESYRRRKQIVDSSGRIIIQVHVIAFSQITVNVTGDFPNTIFPLS